MGKKRKASQPTQDAHRAEDQPRRRPGQVRALRRLPGGPVYHLPELAGDDVKWLTLGASERCDLVLAGAAAEADQVEPVHCSLRCTPELVTIEPYAQGAKTEINNVAVVEGHAELRPGNVLTIGPVRLVACGENIKQRPDITAPGLYEMIQQSVALHGTQSKAADALGIEHKKTFYRWIAQAKFKVTASVVLCMLLGGSYWFMEQRSDSGAQMADSSTPVDVPVATERLRDPVEEHRAAASPAVSNMPMPAATTAESPATNRQARKPSRTEPKKRHAAKPESAEPEPIEASESGGATITPTEGQGITIFPEDEGDQGMTIFPRETR